MNQLMKLIEAADLIERRWESGDLGEAVRLLLEARDEARTELYETSSEDRWIPISRSLPDDEVSAIIHTAEGSIGEAYHEDGEWYWVNTAHPIAIDSPVTHWCELPESPEEN